jgi:hypothetical protein
MKTINLRTLSAALSVTTVAFLSTGCGAGKDGSTGDVPEATIYTIYDVTYNEDDKKLEVETRFHKLNEGGGTLRLEGGSSVTLNGQALPIVQDQALCPEGYCYQLTKQAEEEEAESPLAFRYTDESGKTYDNTLQIPQVPALKLDITKLISKTTEPLKVQWEPFQTQEGEEVSFVISTSDATKAIVLSPEQTLQGTFEIPADQMQSFKAGEGKLQIQRTLTTTPSQKQATGGKVLLKSISKGLPVLFIR